MESRTTVMSMAITKMISKYVPPTPSMPIPIRLLTQSPPQLAQQSFRASPLSDGPTTLSKLSWCTRLGKLICPDELERGYYAVMGGFEVVVGKEENGGDILQTVTPCGTILLARLGLLPPLSTEDINDKSKADLLAKTLVCMQACWMLVQAVARKANGLPITLLELNTIMHVVCALWMYLLWLKKPQDVWTPTIINDMHNSMPLGTLLSINEVQKATLEEGYTEGHKSLPLGTLLIKNKTEEGPAERYMRNIHLSFLIGAREANEERLEARHRILRWKDEVFELGEQSLRERRLGKLITWVRQWHEPQVPSTAPTGGALGLQAARKLCADHLLICHSDGTETYISFRDNTFLTHEKARFLIDYCIGKIPTFGKSRLSWEEFCEEIRGSGYTERASNFELEGSLSSTGSWLAGMTAAVLFPAIYGGVHLIPWNDHFPTYLERFLWRTSGITIASSASFIWYVSDAINTQPSQLVFRPSQLVIRVLTRMRKDTRAPFRSFKQVMELGPGKCRSCKWLFCYPPLVLFGLLSGAMTASGIIGYLASFLVYPCARLYILVEAFASLRSPPERAYDTVVWMDIWPHLS